MKYDRNNLDKATSPYLRQHMDNPVWWQEWNRDVLEYSRENNRILFVSVGYATCHWCHVMAREAFSDKRTADYINTHFVPIKVDKEQRPDIDSYLMSVVVSATGNGGWPLNAFLTPRLDPITALTYAPAESRPGMPSFLEILGKVKEAYDEKGPEIQGFNIPVRAADEQPSNIFLEGLLMDRFSFVFDRMLGGVGSGAKFPPHSQLLFLLYYQAGGGDGTASDMLGTTLDNMLLGGLHDHLQGGFFRYCVDRRWTIPHFEKMLYDQAYLLWIYSMAWRNTRKESYLRCARKIVKCLEETFEEDGLFISGHDADTEHSEGAAYLWDTRELRKNLTGKEFERFAEVYRISEKGNFEGRNHLIKDKDVPLEDIERKLLRIRKKRRQPFADRKKITSLNCAVGIGLIHAYRFAGEKRLLRKAVKLFNTLERQHRNNGFYIHSSIDGIQQKQAFLEDTAWALLFMTYLQEDEGGYTSAMEEQCEKLMTFRNKDGQWVESREADFMPVPSDPLDPATPSSVSAAVLALARADILLGREPENLDFRDPATSSFFNISAMISKGSFYVIHTPERINWTGLPVNVIQTKEGSRSVCYRGTCQKDLPSEWAVREDGI
ncbi:MAG: DUF255 domain-containing protein [Candidatus Omnitrophica bacterium]|nr:DUF255 domain-containing protein [Candidatus Omnitrophota bacterium]